MLSNVKSRFADEDDDSFVQYEGGNFLSEWHKMRYKYQQHVDK